MNKFIKTAAQYLASLGLMALFLYWAFKGIQVSELWEAIKGISLAWVGLIFLTTLLTLVLRGWRWIVFMRPFATHLSIWDTFLALTIGYAANIFIPRSGEALRALSLKWTRGTSISAVLATVVVERILDMVWLILMLGISLLLIRGRIQQAFPWLAPATLIVLVSSVLAGCILALVGLALISLYRERALSLIERLLGRVSSRLAAAVVRILETFLHGLTALHTPSAYLEILVSSILLNLGYIFILYESVAAFGLTRSHGLGFVASLVVMAISSIGVVLPTPGGIGSYHLFFAQGLMIYGVPQAPALACATAVHALATLTYLGIGGPALLLQRRKGAKKSDDPAEE